MYAVWTNIYIVMHVAVSHVHSNVKQSPIKSCPPCCFLTFLTFSQRREGPLQRSENVKKATKESGLNMIKPNNSDYHVRFFL